MEKEEPWENFSQFWHGVVKTMGGGVGNTRRWGGRLILALRKQHVGLLAWIAEAILGAADTSPTLQTGWIKNWAARANFKISMLPVCILFLKRHICTRSPKAGFSPNSSLAVSWKGVRLSRAVVSGVLRLWMERWWRPHQHCRLCLENGSWNWKEMDTWWWQPSLSPGYGSPPWIQESDPGFGSILGPSLTAPS